jgi:glutamate/aspartate transport system substrate-binding protein
LSGKIDLACETMTNNLERQKVVAFSSTYFVAANRFVSKVTANLRTLDDLKGRTVVSTIASTNLKQISELNAQRHLGLTIVAAKDNFEAFRMLESDRAAAHFMDDILLYGAVANSATPADYVVSDDALSVEPYGILLPPDDAAFKKVADDALAAIYRNGDIDKIYARWFLNPIAPNGVNLNVPMSAALKRVIENPTDSGDPQAYATRNAAH